MPSTTQLIEEITDAGVFERLALAVLRRMCPEDCGAVIHEGVNAQGKPVRAPLDGFVVVAGSRRCVMVACTTEKRSALRRKWLSPNSSTLNRTRTTNQGGDLTKAIAEAARIRKNFPESTFKVYLVTNKCGIGGLAGEVASAGALARLDTEVVDASRLADFLDLEPSGQCVRFQFFGTLITHLSLETLRKISRESIEQRQRRPDFLTATRVVKRTQIDHLRNAIAGGKTLVWIVALPGKGKSVLAVETSKEFLLHGGSALWLSENDIAGAETLWEAIDASLRRQCKMLEPEAGRRALQLANPSNPLLLIVDDINRLRDPEAAFEKIRAWVQPLREGENSGFTDTGFVIICPVWPRFYGKLKSGFASSKMEPNEIHIELGDFTNGEAVALFDSAPLSPAQVQQLIEELGSDPLLCAIAAEKCCKSEETVNQVSGNILQKYLSHQLSGVVDQVARPASEYRAALVCLAKSMLLHKNLRPSWSEVTSWIPDADMRTSLRELLQARKPIYLEPETERLLFFHDRFLDLVCAESVPLVIHEIDFRSDPYFAEIIGRAIAEDYVSHDAIELVLNDNPLALFCALRFATRAVMQREFVKRLRRWAQTVRSVPLPDGLFVEIGRVLVQTDCPEIPNLVASLHIDYYGNLAAFRNGSANYGCNYCRYGERDIFLPSLIDPHRDMIVEHARRYHRAELVKDLKTDLVQHGIPIFWRRACLILAGFLAFDELTDAIGCCWNNCPANEKSEIVAEAVWAIIRCAKTRYQELLSSVFQVWQQISNEDHRVGISAYSLSGCPPDWIPEETAAWLVSSLQRFPVLRSALEVLLHESTAPPALEFNVRQIAAISREKGGASLYFALTSLRRESHPQMPVRSLEHLRSIWLEQSQLAEDRDIAFRFWLRSTTWADMETLKSISCHDLIYKSALQRRMQLGDLTCVPELCERLREFPYLLFDCVPIWSVRLCSVAIGLLQNKPREVYYDQSRLTAWFISLPVKDAESILVHLIVTCGHQEEGLLVAGMLIGSARVSGFIMSKPEMEGGIDALLARATFVMNCSWPYLSRGQFLEIWLTNCTQYLNRASQKTLTRFSELCRTSKTRRWYERFLKPLLAPEFHKRTDTEDGVRSLELRFRAMKDVMTGAYEFFRQIDHLGLDRSEVLESIAVSNLRTPSTENLVWLGACIQIAGTRDDLGLLNGSFQGVPTDTLEKLRLDCSFSVRRRVLPSNALDVGGADVGLR